MPAVLSASGGGDPRSTASSGTRRARLAGRLPGSRRVSYVLGSTTLATTQRCLPILRSRVNPSFS